MGLKKIMSAHLQNFGAVKFGFIKETLFLHELTSLNQFFLILFIVLFGEWVLYMQFNVVFSPFLSPS